MNKIFRIGLTAILAGGLLCGAASAEPATPDKGKTKVEMALLGPDRQPRAPQRAVKAPVRRTETRRTQVATPPPPPVKPFVYEKTECKSLTNVPYDLQGGEFFLIQCFFPGFCPLFCCANNISLKAGQRPPGEAV